MSIPPFKVGAWQKRFAAYTSVLNVVIPAQSGWGAALNVVLGVPWKSAQSVSPVVRLVLLCRVLRRQA